MWEGTGHKVPAALYRFTLPVPYIKRIRTYTHYTNYELRSCCEVNRDAVGSLVARRAITLLALVAWPNFRDPEIAAAKNTHTPVIKREPWRLTPGYTRLRNLSHMGNLQIYQEKACPKLA